MDSVLNIKGYRLSIADVEATLTIHSVVDEAFAVPLEDDGGIQALGICLTLTTGSVVNAALRTELVGLLPLHMRPRHLLVLSSIPRLPNGKVDRQALREQCSRYPYEDKVLTRSDEEEDMSELERQLLLLAQQEAGSLLSLDDSIPDAGVDSLGAVRLAAAIEETFGRRMTLTSIYEASTVRKVAQLLRRDHDSEEEAIVPLNRAAIAERPSLFYVPGLNGHPYDFLPVVKHMRTERKVYGLQYPRKSLTTMEDIASYFVQNLCRIQPQGPYLLAGHSLGGRVAYEIARQLQLKAGIQAFPVFVDASAPLLTRSARMRKTVRRLVHYAQRLEYARSHHQLIQLFRHRIRILLSRPPVTQHIASASPMQLVSIRLADKKYCPAPMPGGAVLLKAAGAPPIDRGLFGKGVGYGWDRLALAGLEVISTPGDHVSCIRNPQNAEQLASHLENILDRVQGGWRNVAEAHG